MTKTDRIIVGQALPSELSPSRYLEDEAKIRAALGSLGGGLRSECEFFEPYPMIVSPEASKQVVAIGEAVHAGVVAVLRHWRADPRIRDRVGIGDELARLLADVDPSSSAPAMIRLDLLVDERGGLRVCEVNARFLANGSVDSELLSRALGALELPAGLRPVAGVRGFTDAMLGVCGAEEPIGLVMEAERGDEIHALLHGADVVRAKPADLRCTARGLALASGPPTLVGRELGAVVLELDRSELARFEAPVLRRLARWGRTFNPIDTVAIAHDKRVLAALSDASIMRSYLGEAQVEVLRESVIPTFPGSDPRARAQAAATPEDWVLKQASSGRGAGVWMGADMAPAQWRDRLEALASASALQCFVAQPSFPITRVERGRLTRTPMKVVGMVTIVGGRVLGLGNFRVATGPVINTHEGRAIELASVEAVDPLPSA